ncbi:exopolysaccharide production negative regulator [Brucella abortus]|uniref:Sel1-like repeat n=4 Tax=Brucella abortus TaxID=235 RepID=Q2YNK4_BRUA2|nr:ExoR, exopolysacchride production negative regulator [Brucella abortus bv. 1 str. 9-941]ACD72352.1 Sel1-like repeat [Brucella abortus S19]ALF29435.1 exopolysaccharide production negative regulator [Brucella abortus 104M]AOG43577.1 exopolysaccharide production negative regulator [Brucella sp. 2002734562]ASZ86538.1 sel1 repeat family protein [Brucella abortus]ERM06181.1 Exopolysaccharide production negative regulator [Brucella abortus S99]QIS27762.1 sel1 repeat family protein [Brucella abort
MRSRSFSCSAIAMALGLVLTLALACHSTFAFDLNDDSEKSRSPFELFKFGFSAYKNGHKDEAIKALRYAAERGHQGAKWKLARMYAEGDGVAEDDYEAYKIFEKIVRDGSEPGSENAPYVADALVALAGYVKNGIPGSPVQANPNMARELYVQAAANFGDSIAQFELGKMLLDGEGGERNAVQAARWFQLAARKGNTGAQAMLGNMLFQAGKTVRGLAMLTAAFERCPAEDCTWIRDMQEQAFSIAGEADRRNAIALASDYAVKGSY